MDSEGQRPRRKPIFEGVAYYAPDGRNLGATLRLARFRSTPDAMCRVFGAAVACVLGALAATALLRPAGSTPAMRLIQLGPALGVLIGRLVRIQYDRPRIELYGDVFVAAPEGRTFEWARTSRFGVLRSRRDGPRAMDVVVVLDCGSVVPLFGESLMYFARDRDVDALADYLNAFKAADDDGRMALIRDFRPIRLPTDRRP